MLSKLCLKSSSFFQCSLFLSRFLPDFLQLLIGAKNWTQTFFSQTFRLPPGYPSKIPEDPAKNVGFPWFRGTYRTFWAPPFTWKTPTPAENIRTQKFGFVLLFSCLSWARVADRKPASATKAARFCSSLPPEVACSIFGLGHRIHRGPGWAWATIFYPLRYAMFSSKMWPQQVCGSEKNIKKMFTGLSRDFWGDFVYVFFSPIKKEKQKKHKQPEAAQSGAIPQICLCLCFCSFPESGGPLNHFVLNPDISKCYFPARGAV